MTHKTARDITVPIENYPHTLDTQTLGDAVKLLQEAQIQFSGKTSMPRILLVFDDSNQLLGMVRRRDILRGLEPDFHRDLNVTHPEIHILTEIDPNLSDLADPTDTEALRQRLDKPIGSVVREMPGRVNVDDSLMRAARELVGNDTHIAAVVDDGKVVGVVRSLDLLHAMTEELVQDA